MVEPLMALQPFCALWMAFKAFRDEKNRLPYVAAIALVPLGWLWYYVERVRPRVRNRGRSVAMHLSDLATRSWTESLDRDEMLRLIRSQELLGHAHILNALSI